MSEAGEITGKGVETSRTLVPPRSKDVPPRMMNRRDAAVRLHKGATLAELQPVDVVETDYTADEGGAAARVYQ